MSFGNGKRPVPTMETRRSALPLKSSWRGAVGCAINAEKSVLPSGRIAECDLGNGEVGRTRRDAKSSYFNRGAGTYPCDMAF